MKVTTETVEIDVVKIELTEDDAQCLYDLLLKVKVKEIEHSVDSLKITAEELSVVKRLTEVIYDSTGIV